MGCNPCRNSSQSLWRPLRGSFFAAFTQLRRSGSLRARSGGTTEAALRSARLTGFRHAMLSLTNATAPAAQQSRRRVAGRRSGPPRAGRVAALIAGFADYVGSFEVSQAFPGPSLYSIVGPSSGGASIRSWVHCWPIPSSLSMRTRSCRPWACTGWGRRRQRSPTSARS